MFSVNTSESASSFYRLIFSIVSRNSVFAFSKSVTAFTLWINLSAAASIFYLSCCK